MPPSLRGIQADRKRSYYSIEQDAAELRGLLGIGPLDRFDVREPLNKSHVGTPLL